MTFHSLLHYLQYTKRKRQKGCRDKWRASQRMKESGVHFGLEFLIKVSSIAKATKTFTEFQQLMVEFTIETTRYSSVLP